VIVPLQQTAFWFDRIGARKVLKPYQTSKDYGRRLREFEYRILIDKTPGEQLYRRGGSIYTFGGRASPPSLPWLFLMPLLVIIAIVRKTGNKFLTPFCKPWHWCGNDPQFLEAAGSWPKGS